MGVGHDRREKITISQSTPSRRFLSQAVCGVIPRKQGKCPAYRERAAQCDYFPASGLENPIISHGLGTRANDLQWSSKSCCFIYMT